MHEGVYTEQIVQAILEGVKAQGGGRILKARVVVGEMLHLQADAVRLHYEALAKGTPLEGSELDLVEAKVRLRCRACGAESEPEDHHLLQCPCGSREVEVLAGRGVQVESVEVDDGV
jgi:hydrogenase nickel incorporation protein HypA/HybF